MRRQATPGGRLTTADGARFRAAASIGREKPMIDPGSRKVPRELSGASGPAVAKSPGVLDAAAEPSGLPRRISPSEPPSSGESSKSPETAAQGSLRGIYSRQYFLSDCEGYREFLRTWGKKLPKRLAKCLDLLAPSPGELVLDIGCGRGELCLHAAARGSLVCAVDISKDALALLSEAERAWRESGAFPEGRCARPWLVLAFGRELPFSTGCVDKIVLADVLEHIDRSEQEETLRECRRVLRWGGTIVIHTQPNRTLLRWSVPVLRRISRLWGVKVPRDLRSEASPGARPPFHREELSETRLRKLLSATGFESREVWVEGSWALHRVFGNAWFKPVLLRLFRRSRVFRRLLGIRIFAVATKPSAV